MKRRLAFLLILSMLLCSINITAFADGPTDGTFVAYYESWTDDDGTVQGAVRYVCATSSTYVIDDPEEAAIAEPVDEIAITERYVRFALQQPDKDVGRIYQVEVILYKGGAVRKRMRNYYNPSDPDYLQLTDMQFTIDMLNYDSFEIEARWNEYESMGPCELSDEGECMFLDVVFEEERGYTWLEDRSIIYEEAYNELPDSTGKTPGHYRCNIYEGKTEGSKLNIKAPDGFELDYLELDTGEEVQASELAKKTDGTYVYTLSEDDASPYDEDWDWICITVYLKEAQSGPVNPPTPPTPSDSADDSSSTSSTSTGTGTWDMPTSGTWTLGADGKWQFANGTYKPFKNTWGMIVNPYAKMGQNSADWFWFDADGSMATGFRTINGKTFYFNESSDGTLGAMKTGLVTIGANRYYFATTRDSNGGAMVTGWVDINGKFYYFRNDGRMAVNATTPDGYRVDATGARI
ncbi:MAG: hypothetical protein Q4B67_03205 [Eubacteriales bacterium]|nr:hypothetical protein [Eubacteriales bacterium]